MLPMFTVLCSEYGSPKYLAAKAAEIAPVTGVNPAVLDQNSSEV